MKVKETNDSHVAHRTASRRAQHTASRPAQGAHHPVHLSREAREGRQRGAGSRHLSALGDSLGESKGSNGAGGAAPAEVQQFIQQAAAAYGANPQVLSEIARRESNFNTGDIPNTTDSNARRGTPSRGMFQFIEPTFQSMAPRARAANPQAWQGVSATWTDWRAQALTTAWAITHGQGRHWSTYQAATASAGGARQTRTA